MPCLVISARGLRDILIEIDTLEAKNAVAEQAIKDIPEPAPCGNTALYVTLAASSAAVILLIFLK